MKIRFIIYLIMSTFFLSSCDSYLEEDPKGLISDTYAKTEEGIESLILSLYQRNRTLPDRLMLFADTGTDVTTYGMKGVGWAYESSSYNDALLISNTVNSEFWTYLYQLLNIANTGVLYVNEASISSDKKRDFLTSEVHALRAFYLYLIIETWGPASHYAETPSQSAITDGYQPGIAIFYNRILKDLDIAAQALDDPQNTKWGRMNTGVVKGIRMRVLMSLAAYDESILSKTSYTKQKCYEESITLCNSLINDYNYQLLSDYASIFDVNNQINKEVIWSIQFTSDLIYNGMDQKGPDGKYTDDANYCHRYFVGWYNKSVKNTNLNIDGLWSHSRVYGREYRVVMPTYYYITCFNKYDKRREQTFQTAWCRIPDNWNNEPDYSDTLLIRTLDVVTPEFIKAYEEKGIAVDNISDIYDINTGIPTVDGRSCANTVTKFLDPSRDDAKREQGFKDVILLRLGEVYITLAEAYVRTNQPDKAAQVITQLRERALTKGHEEELKVSVSDMNMEFILEEGARELGCELNRWYMLKRTGLLVDWVKQKNPDITLIKDYHIYRPLPQDALYEVTNINEFKQNQGYK